MNTHSKVVIVMPIVVLFLAGCGYVVYWTYCSIMYTGREYAIYGHMRLVGDADGYWCLAADDLDEQSKLARLFIRLPDGRVVLLSKLDEQVIAELHKDKSRDGTGQPVTDKGDARGIVTIYRWRLSGFSFAKGRLVAVVLAEDSFDIAVSPNGPFYRFPIARKISEQLFGKPNEIRKQKWDITRGKL